MPIERNPRVWQIGNTGFRNAERLVSFLGLIEAQSTPLWQPGLARGPAMAHAKGFLAKKIEQAHEENPYGARPLMRIDPVLQSKDGIAKGLAAAIELGLLHPSTVAPGVTGPALFTALGKSFCKANTERSQKLVFAQALANYEVTVQGSSGFPLQRLAQVFMGLQMLEPNKAVHISRGELAWCVLTAPLSGPAQDIAQAVLDYRQQAQRRKTQRESREAKLSRENAALVKMGLPLEGFSRNTLMEYANVTMLHLLFTGLFHIDSSTHVLMPDTLQHEVWRALAQGDRSPWKTPAVKKALVARLEEKLGVSLAGKQNIIASGLELLDRRAMNHRMSTPESDERIGAILARDPVVAWGVDQAFNIKDLKAEPAAMEWAMSAWVCRAMARSNIEQMGEGWRGRVDVAGRPERPSSGGDADAILETQSTRFVIEATLLTHSRQEACEGESVRRHVACSNPPTAKVVWGLFGAPSLDSNTLLSFLQGGYFEGEEWKQARIIPLSFEQMRTLHVAGMTFEIMTGLFETIWNACPAGLSPPQQVQAWRVAIDQAVGAAVQTLKSPAVTA